MAQRIHRCISNTNMETIKCDAYVPTLLKPSKYTALSKQRMSPTCQRRAVSVPRTPSIMSVEKQIRPCSYQAKDSLMKPNKGTPRSVIHKEIIANEAALVEVTVRTHKKKQNSKANRASNSKDRWENILKPYESMQTSSSFENFDPLRTLHFLIQELSTKLQGVIPSELYNLKYDLISFYIYCLANISKIFTSMLRSE